MLSLAVLLIPNFCYMKEWWRSATRRVAQVPCKAIAPFFIAPTERYQYRAPNGALGANGVARKAGQVKTSPFLTFWHCTISVK